MIWCIVSMIFGAMIFCGGLVFERLLNLSDTQTEEKGDEPTVDGQLLRQWENLLGYDGTKQEVDDENS